MEQKSGTGADAQAVDEAENERREGMGLAAVVYRKRQANIRRSRYADYSARLELV
jgi:hypothetical protein